MNLFHNKCENAVLLDISGSIRFLASMGFGKTSLKIGPGDIIVKDEPPEVVFYCPACRVTVLKEKLFGYCSQCGKKFPITELYVPNQAGGIYCKECVNELSENFKPLSSFCNEVSLK